MSEEVARKVCLEMIQQRGYSIINEDDSRITALKPDGNQMVVCFNEAPKFDTKSMKEIISIMNELEIKHSIVIYKEGVTSATKNTLSQSEEMRIELFALEDLQYNITKHRLQPTFHRIPDDEATEFKKKYGTKFGILRIDKPISCFYDYKKGDIIRIIRGNYINYRIVK